MHMEAYLWCGLPGRWGPCRMVVRYLESYILILLIPGTPGWDAGCSGLINSSTLCKVMVCDGTCCCESAPTVLSVL